MAAESQSLRIQLSTHGHVADALAQRRSAFHTSPAYLIDHVISGHTHAGYNCRLPNASGRMISVTSASAFGRVLTDIDVTIDPASRDITDVTATNRLVDRTAPEVPPDATIDALAAYMARFGDPNPPYAHGTHPDDQGSPRLNRTGGSACPTGANVNP